MKDDAVTRVSTVAYFISKFDKDALNALGYTTYSDAFEKLGPCLGKSGNYMHFRRDEFDALVSSSRKGWHKRSPAPAVLEYHNELKDYSFDELKQICLSFINDSGVLTDKCSELSSPKIEQTARMSVAKHDYVSDGANYIIKIAEKCGDELKDCGHNLHASENKNVAILQISSKVYPRANGISEFWYSVHPRQISNLMGYSRTFISFVLSAMQSAIVIDCRIFLTLLGLLPTTTNERETYWHVKIRTDGKSYWLLNKGDNIILDEKNTFLIIKLAEESNNGRRIKIKTNNFKEIKSKKH